MFNTRNGTLKFKKFKFISKEAFEEWLARNDEIYRCYSGIDWEKPFIGSIKYDSIWDICDDYGNSILSEEDECPSIAFNADAMESYLECVDENPQYPRDKSSLMEEAIELVEDIGESLGQLASVLKKIDFDLDL